MISAELFRFRIQCCFPIRLRQRIVFSCLSSSGAGEYAQGKQGVNEQRQVNLLDNLSVSQGSHQLKFGVDYRWLAPFTNPFVIGPFFSSQE